MYSEDLNKELCDCHTRNRHIFHPMEGNPCTCPTCIPYKEEKNMRKVTKKPNKKKYIPPEAHVCNHKWNYSLLLGVICYLVLIAYMIYRIIMWAIK